MGKLDRMIKECESNQKQFEKKHKGMYYCPLIRSLDSMKFGCKYLNQEIEEIENITSPSDWCIGYFHRCDKR